MRGLRACILLMLLGATTASAQAFSIYLVRHAEKQGPSMMSAGPGLTDCGHRRAAALADFLVDIPLRAVYATEYRRTQETAAPAAALHGLQIEPYAPRELATLAQQLRERGEDALVVGHSNTTAVLAGLLSGHEGAAYDESDYSRLYQVVIGQGSARQYLYRQTFSCEP